MYTVLSSEDYRETLANNPTESDIEEIRAEIVEELQDIISYCRIDSDDIEELVDLVEFTEVAVIWIDSTVGEEYKKNKKAAKSARLLVKRLVNSMYFNRSIEISSSAKTDIITKNILSKLANMGDE